MHYALEWWAANSNSKITRDQTLHLTLSGSQIKLWFSNTDYTDTLWRSFKKYNGSDCNLPFICTFTDVIYLHAVCLGNAVWFSSLMAKGNMFRVECSAFCTCGRNTFIEHYVRNNHSFLEDGKNIVPDLIKHWWRLIKMALPEKESMITYCSQLR